MRASIIILNWNGWKDTVECLESVLRLDYPGFRVVVCDNGSTDGSLDKIRAWARGELVIQAESPQLAHLVSPPYPKPIPYLDLTRDEAESGSTPNDCQLVLVQNGANLGFAAGCNVGLRYVLGDDDSQFFWILNNDTVVTPDALSAMTRVMQEHREVGLCGSLTLSYAHPQEVQTTGGNNYSRWTGRVAKRPHYLVHELPPITPKFDYVNGASMLASRDFLETVGLMEESYFLYFEELDWAARAKGKFALGCARKSAIYHKEGAAVGSHADRMKRSLLSERYLTRNRVLFTRRYFPWALPSVIAAICAGAMERICRGNWNHGKTMLSVMIDSLAIEVPRTADHKA